MTDFTKIARATIRNWASLDAGTRSAIINALSAVHTGGYNAGYRNALHAVAVHDSEYVGGE